MSNFRMPRDDRGGVRAAVKQLAALSLVACLCSVLGAKYLSQKFNGGDFATLSERESVAMRNAGLTPAARGRAIPNGAGIDNMATATIPNKGAFAGKPLTPRGETTDLPK